MERKMSFFVTITVCSAIIATLLMLLLTVKTAFAATKTPVPDELGSCYSADCLGAAASDSDGEADTDLSSKATGKSKAEKAANKLVDLGEYWGWYGVVDRVKTSKKESSAYVTLSNSKYVFGDIKVKSTSKKTTYTFKGTKFTFAGFKSSLKDYSSAADRQAVLESKAKSAAKKLQRYGSQRSWTAELITKFKNKKANTTIKFANTNYNYKVVVTTARSNNKITTSYKAQGKKSTVKNIKSMLEKYKAVATAANAAANFGESLGSNPDGAIMEVDTTASVSLEADTATNDGLLPAEPITEISVSENTILDESVSEDNIISLSDEPSSEEGKELITDYINYEVF